MAGPWLHLSDTSCTRVAILTKISPQVTCTLLEVDLGADDARSLPYEAISYVWGPKTDLVVISCNGAEILIPRNLSLAMIMIGRYRPNVKLWADAVCINQEDEQEKARQVMMMDVIFHKAERVNVWLGTDIDYSALVWKLIQWHISSQWTGIDYEPGRSPSQILDGEILRQCQEGETDSRSQVSKQLRFSNTSETFESCNESKDTIIESYTWMDEISGPWRRLFLDHEARACLMKSLGKVCNSKWFTRVWTLQEILLAKFAMVWTGDSAICWHQLREFLVNIDVCFDFEDDLYAACYPAMDHVFLLPPIPNFVLNKNSTAAIRTAIFRTATEPRDMFFALQGLLSNPLRCVVNYESATSTVYLYGTRLFLTIASQPVDFYRMLQRAGLSMRRHLPQDPLGKYEFCPVLLNEHSLSDGSQLLSWIPSYTCERCMDRPSFHPAGHNPDWETQSEQQYDRLVSNGLHGRLRVEGAFIGYIGDHHRPNYADDFFSFHNMPPCVRNVNEIRTYPGRYHDMNIVQLAMLHKIVQQHCLGSCACSTGKRRFMTLLARLTYGQRNDKGHRPSHKTSTREEYHDSSCDLSLFACADAAGMFRPARGWTSAIQPGDLVFELQQIRWNNPGLIVVRAVNTRQTSERDTHDDPLEFLLIEADTTEHYTALTFGGVVHNHNIRDIERPEINQCPLAASGGHLNYAITLV